MRCLRPGSPVSSDDFLSSLPVVRAQLQIPRYMSWLFWRVNGYNLNPSMGQKASDRAAPISSPRGFIRVAAVA